MNRDDIFVGLEIGTSKICAVVGEARMDGTVRVLGVGEAPSRGVRKGEIIDFEIAGKCVREALADAEEKSDVMIRSVQLAITGAHVQSFNNRGAISIPEDRDEICEEDFDEVQAAAREVSLPSGNQFLHSILQLYYVDGQDGVLNPVGMCGRQLEADFHIIHGIGTRVKNSIRCVLELDIEVDDIIFSPIASSQVVLDLNQKTQGALVIDMGGGTTGYVLYVGGAVRHSGVLAVGGDHINNDLAFGLRLPLARAERLKEEEGSVVLGAGKPGETITLRDETGFAGREIERERLNSIIYDRVRETLELVKRDLEQKGGELDFLGAGVLLTGGCSLLRGIDQLAEDVFGLPVRLTHAHSISGITSAFENPQYSTAIGLIKYAQMQQQQKPGGWFSRIRSKLSFLNLW